jgi:hypothetical protein
LEQFFEEGIFSKDLNEIKMGVAGTRCPSLYAILALIIPRIGVNRLPRAQRGSRGIALLILNLGARRGWVVSTKPRSLYPWERPGTHCTGGWVDPRAGLDVC